MSPDPLRQRLGGVVRGVASAARTPAARLVKRARAGSPHVTAVVLLTGAEAAAREAIDAVRDQPDPGLEILAVLLDDRLRPPAEEAVRGDWRVRRVVVGRDDPGVGRHVGSRAARAPWLVFVSPRQVLLPGAVAALLTAAGSSSTVVLGALEGSIAPWPRTPLLGRLLVPRERWASTSDDAEPDGQTAAVALLTAGFT